jgi:hypothetical protein
MDGPALAQPPETTGIPLPPVSGVYDTYDQLKAFLQDFYCRNGAALRVENSNSRKILGMMQKATVTLVCDKSGAPISVSTGLRRSSSQKCHCPFKLKALVTQELG